MFSPIVKGQLPNGSPQQPSSTQVSSPALSTAQRNGIIGGAIAGGVVLICLILWLAFRQRRREEQTQRLEESIWSEEKNRSAAIKIAQAQSRKLARMREDLLRYETEAAQLRAAMEESENSALAPHNHGGQLEISEVMEVEQEVNNEVEQLRNQVAVLQAAVRQLEARVEGEPEPPPTYHMNRT